MMKSNVTVYLCVFNEESRIESCLKSFCWADELIVFDKSSTDRTLDIAKKYATEVISLPFTNGSEHIVQNLASRGSCDWGLFVTASSLIHPSLVREIVKLTTDNHFKFDVIGMPYGMYAFGIRNRKSPWTTLWKNTLIRKSALKLSDKLHNEVGYVTNEIYNIPFMGNDEVLYHCTHKDADDFLGRTIRYSKYEADYDQSIGRAPALRRAFGEILKSIFTVFLRRHTFILGWDGVALSLAYVCNFIIKFIHVWDLHRQNGNVVYPALRSKIDNLWSQRSVDALNEKEINNVYK